MVQSDTQITGNIVSDDIVPAREPWSAILKRGQFLRLIDLEGQQAIDFLCFNATDPSSSAPSIPQ